MNSFSGPVRYEVFPGLREIRPKRVEGGGQIIKMENWGRRGTLLRDFGD